MGWGRGSRKGKDKFVTRTDSAVTTLGPQTGVGWGWGIRRQERGGVRERGPGGREQEDSAEDTHHPHSQVVPTWGTWTAALQPWLLSEAL